MRTLPYRRCPHYPSEADIRVTHRHVCFGPISDEPPDSVDVCNRPEAAAANTERRKYEEEMRRLAEDKLLGGKRH
jgi:hypothetical protein